MVQNDKKVLIGYGSDLLLPTIPTRFRNPTVSERLARGVVPKLETKGPARLEVGWSRGWRGSRKLTFHPGCPKQVGTPSYQVLCQGEPTLFGVFGLSISKLPHKKGSESTESLRKWGMNQQQIGFQLAKSGDKVDGFCQISAKSRSLMWLT